ncbi:hypothetical protein ACGCUQ_05820 [Eubacteriales bacterium KG127]
MLTLDVKTLLIGLLIISLIVLVVFIIVLIANAIKALKKVILMLEDTQSVTAIVANRADQLDEGVDSMLESVSNFKDSMKDKFSGNSGKGLIGNIKDLKNAGATIKDTINNFSSLKNGNGSNEGNMNRARRSLKSQEMREARNARRKSRFAPSERHERY